jgi:alkylation response protein AidB-like acyl-CoA dehydrogenase
MADEQWMESAKELGAQADKRWRELDADCRLPQDLYDAALEARLLRTLVPARLGGTDGTPLDWFRLGVALASHEPSFGWVITQGAVELGWIAAAGDPAWASEVLSDPKAACASSVAGLGELKIDGTKPRFGGRWNFNSGVHGATWIGGLARVEGASNADGSPDIRFAWVPADRVEILDDWDPSGLRGSGSCSTFIPEQAIEMAWIFRPFSPTGNEDGPHGCLIGNGNWPIATSVAATQLGAARRAIDEAIAVVAHKRSAPDLVPLAENAAVQRELLRIEGLWNACRASVERELGSMWEQANCLGELSIDQRVNLFAANSTANDQSVMIVNKVCELTGTVALDQSHPLNRVRRDAQALQGHRATNGAAIEMAGRIRLGLLSEHRRV